MFKMGQRYLCDINATVINIQHYEIYLFNKGSAWKRGSN